METFTGLVGRSCCASDKCVRMIICLMLSSFKWCNNRDNYKKL